MNTTHSANPEQFVASNGVRIERISDTSIRVMCAPEPDDGIVYLLPIPTLRIAADSLAAWRARAAQLATEGSLRRHEAVIEFIERREPDPALIRAA